MGKLKKMSRVKSVSLFLVILSLVTTGTFSYKVGYFPIIGKIIADKKLTEYNSTQSQNSQPIKTKFDWYNARYHYDLTDGFSLSYRLQHNTIHDEESNSQVNQRAKEDYNNILEKIPGNLEFPKSIDVWTTMSADNYTIESQRLYLLGVYNNENITEEESYKMPANIAKNVINLMGSDYNFTGIQLIYADKNGMYQIALPSDTFEPLEEKELIDNTVKFSKEELPLDYLEWLEKR